MDNLTSEQLLILNNLSRVMKQNVLLGTIIDSVIDQAPSNGTAVNAVNASKNLAFTGVVKHNETVTINNPAVSGSNVYEFLADAAQEKTSPNNIAVDITDYTVKASVTLTVDTQPTAGDTFTIGTLSYIFVPLGTGNFDGEIALGATLGATQLNIVAAINGTDDHNEPHPLVSCGDFSSDDAVITAFIGGSAGNSIVSTETFTAETNIFSSATFASGGDCSAANAETVLVAAINANDTQGVTAAGGAGTSVDLTADVAGVIGNAIILAETLANGAFSGGAVLLSGGVDGTVGPQGKLLVDNSYLYVAIDENTTAGKNWRRISLGSAF